MLVSVCMCMHECMMHVVVVLSAYMLLPLGPLATRKAGGTTWLRRAQSNDGRVRLFISLLEVLHGCLEMDGFQC